MEATWEIELDNDTNMDEVKLLQLMFYKTNYITYPSILCSHTGIQAKSDTKQNSNSFVESYV